MQHPVAHTVTLAPVSRVLHQQNLRIRLAILPHDLRRIVTRAVVHHKNFRIPFLLPGIPEKFIEGWPDAGAFVIGGDFFRRKFRLLMTVSFDFSMIFAAFAGTALSKENASTHSPPPRAPDPAARILTSI